MAYRQLALHATCWLPLQPQGMPGLPPGINPALLQQLQMQHQMQQQQQQMQQRQMQQMHPNPQQQLSSAQLMAALGLGQGGMPPQGMR